MSQENQDYTIHQIHGFDQNCGWCVDQRPKQKKINYEEIGEKFRRVANNLDKMGVMVKIIEKAKKKNPNNLPF